MGELFPGSRVLGNRVRHGLSHFGAEFFVAPRAPGAAQHGEFAGQASLAEELEQRRYELAVGEVTAGPKDHDALRGDHPLLPQPHPQGVGEEGGHAVKTGRMVQV